jgi:CheY-like chemotaxis protein
VVLVAVTGWGQEQDRRRAVAAGFDHHLVKPISAETVETLLHSLAREPAR